AALADFARRMLPHAPPLPMPASADVDMDAEPDAAAVRALLAPLMAGAPARQQALGADELAQMFLAAHRLGTLAGALRALPPVRAPLAVWWRAGRAGAAARLAQWQGAPLREAVLDGVDHHAIVRDARLVEALAALAPDRQAPGNATAGGAGNGMQTTTLLTE
ncbi:hypothetical protein, partial [Cupriavidus sp. WS]|uniref:hypothetical protein n=1 Tax=Cupriavidus sp. WS TaxID=1312922 RepID=UPI0005B7713D